MSFHQSPQGKTPNDESQVEMPTEESLDPIPTTADDRARMLVHQRDLDWEVGHVSSVEAQAWVTCHGMAFHASTELFISNGSRVGSCAHVR